MRIRALATAVVAATLLVGTAGCGVITPTATMKHYDASDGISTNVGELRIRNAFIVTNEVGDAALVTTIVNGGSSLEFLKIEVRGGTNLSTQVGAYPGLTKVGIADDNPIVFYGAGVTAGEYVDVYFQYGDNEGRLIAVPVLDGTEPMYAPYAPTVAPEPTPEATDEASN